MTSFFLPPRLRAPLEALAQRLDALPPLPARWQALQGPQARMAGWLRRLPSRPPSQVLAVLLNRGLWPQLPEELQQGLVGRVITLEVSDLGWRLRLRGRADGFEAAGDGAEAALRIAARAAGWLQMQVGLPWAVARAKRLAAAFHALKMRDYGRIDYRLTQEGRLVFIEANPNSDLTPHTLGTNLCFPGITYERLIPLIVETALQRYRGR